MAEGTLTPGTVLLDRFVLEDLVEFDDGVAVWRAFDRTLQRSVSIRTVADDDPRAQNLRAAARDAAPLVDPRVLRVLDTAADRNVTFTISEWVRGISLEDQVERGPLDPLEAARLIREAADAIAAAHRVGISHGSLSPGKLLRRGDGAVRIIGFGVDQVLHPRPEHPADPQADDVHQLGKLLFTALAGRLPDGSAEDVSPGRVRAGVPRPLDALCSSVLLRRNLSARQLRDGIDEFLADSALPPARPRVAKITAPPSHEVEGGRPGRWLLWAGLVAIAVLALVLFAVVASLRLPKATDAGPGSAGSTGSTTGSTSGSQSLQISSIRDYDPLQKGQPREENPAEVPLAVDGDPSTAWRTLTYYGNPKLGGLKAGVGLLIDLGSQQQVRAVDVTLIGQPTALSLLVAPGVDQVPALPSDFDTAASYQGTNTQVELTPTQPVTTRYLVVWLTSLPPAPGGYQGAVAEVSVLP
jgi:putative peptidoglycan lipid II flippase